LFKLNNMKATGLAILICSIMFSSARGQELAVKTDFNGAVVNGSIEKLIEAVRQGKEIRVGWSLDFNGDGAGNLEHFIDAKFLTILNGHVFNQIDPIYAQAPNEQIPQVEIGNSEMKWTAIIGTNGLLVSRFIIPNIESQKDENNKKQLELMSKINQEKVETSWFIIN